MSTNPNESSDGTPQYDVGYGKPPKHSQFQKGNKSGKGRKKGSKALKTIVNEAMNAKVVVNKDGKKTKLSKVELSVHQLASKAAAGDFKATDKLLSLAERYGPAQEPDAPPRDKIARDIIALEKFVAMKRYFASEDGEKEKGDD